jgi:sugar phosphate isomerase/epimerase
MRIAIVTDEMSADPETAFELGLEAGIRHFELRGVYNKRVPRIGAHAEARLMRAIRDFDVAITAVSPGLFKIPLPPEEPARSNLGWMDEGFFRSWQDGQAALRDHMDRLLPESIEFAGKVGARFIVAFSFHRAGAPGGPPPSRAVDCLGKAADKARAAGLTLLVETEEGFFADTGARSAALIEAIGADRAGINWDPANSFCEGDVPYPDGYAALRSHVRNVHFKDARRLADGTAAFVANGDVDWQGQIGALASDGYDGFIAIEPHLERPVQAVRDALGRLRSLIAAASSSTKEKTP